MPIPNPLVIIDRYELLVAFLLDQREGYLELIEHLTGRVLELQDAAPPRRRGKFIPCGLCTKQFQRGGTRSEYCPTCRPKRKAETDRAVWQLRGKARRAERRRQARAHKEATA